MCKRSIKNLACTTKKYREEQNYRKSFKKVLLYYQIGELASASETLEKLLNRKVDARTSRKIQQVLLLLLVGELYGLNTLNKLLTNYGVRGNNYQQLWQKLPSKLLISLMNDWLWDLFGEDFEKRLHQSGSTHSRQKLTLVIDGSIFKQWLVDEEFGKYFAKYYSGQYKSAVYGFNVILCGMAIGGLFYPLQFQLRRKSEKDSEVAENILAKVHKKLDAIALSEGVKLPQLYLSVDSGFRSTGLLAYCEASGIIYIGVPKINHTITYKGKKYKIKDLKAKFIQQEQLYQQKNLKSEQAFTWRVRVTYKCMDREVTLLFFRLNESKKVSVIFSTNLDIKAKTMRRHWFERTKIELLFRMIKNDFKIQQITVRNRLGFMKKLAFALVKSVYMQLFTQKVKKSDSQFQRLGFAGIRQKLIFHQIGKEYLDELVYANTFCKDKFR